MAVRDRLLGTRAGYSAFRRLIRADRGMRLLVDEHIAPSSGDVIGDLGCGTGDLAGMLPADATYIGIDHNPAYISPTSLSFEPGGRYFVNGDLAELASLDLPPLDVAVAIGVLHHLTDDQVLAMLAAVVTKLAPGGRLVTVDPVFHPDQASSARIMMAMDRGRYVRHQSHYEWLVRQVLPEARCRIRTDVNPFPYTHIVFSTGVERT